MKNRLSLRNILTHLKSCLAKLSIFHFTVKERIMIMEYVHHALMSIENGIDELTQRAELFRTLSEQLSLSDFGLLMFSLPDPKYPKMSRILPRMVASDVQKTWTGSSGVMLLMQSLDFVRSLFYNYMKYTGGG